MSQKPLNVLIDTAPLETGHAVRGIGTYTRLLVKALEARGDVTVRRSSQVASSEHFSPDIIHYPYFDLFYPTLPVQLTKKTVVTIHDVIPLLFPDHYPVGLKGTIAFRLQQLALKTVNAIVTDSQASKHDICTHLQIEPTRVHVVQLAANPELRPQKPDRIAAIRAKYQLPEQYLLYVGDINYNKNIPQLIKMLKFLPDQVELVCVGKNFTPQPIPEWQWIEAQVALSDVGHRVHFVTTVLVDAIDELAALYSGALVYVQPSLYEGFGLPVLEAMQCKTPVVCSANSSLLEVGGEHVVYAQPSAESLAAGVEQVLAWSKTARATRLKQAYDWSQLFTWEKTAAATVAVYRGVVS